MTIEDPNVGGPYMNPKLRNKRYKQALIQRDNIEWIAWIPLELAKPDLIIVPKGEEPAVVKRVWRTTKTHEEVIAMGETFKHHRSVSDI